jgi:hypothetical protein
MLLETVGGTALTEGIAFLYAQAGELLRRWREKRDAVEEESALGVAQVHAELPPALGGTALDASADLAAVARLSDRMVELCGQLGNYANGIAAVPADDGELRRQTGELRDGLEEVLGQRLTFAGEPREPSGTPIVRGRVSIGVVYGSATGVEADEVEGSAHVSGDAVADVVEQGGSLSGVHARRVSGSG